MKNMKVSKTFLVIIALIVAWTPFAAQRLSVLVEADVPIDRVVSTMSGIKYVLGLSYSAEEMKFLLHLRKSFK